MTRSNVRRATPIRPQRTRRRAAWRLAVTAVLAAPAVGGMTSSPAVATNLLSPATAFEIDGNPDVDGNGGIPDPEIAGDFAGGYGPGLTPEGNPTTGVYYLHRDSDPCASDLDDVGVGGDKAEDGPVWPIAVGQPNTKTDLAAVTVAAEKVAVPDLQIEDVLYVAFERCGGGSGSMSTLLAIDDGDGVPPSEGDDGDFMFRFDFQPNTGDTDITMFIRAAGSWVDTPIPAGSVAAAAAPSPGDFGEVALNLTALGIIDEEVCDPVTVGGQATTITGGDLRSQPKDIVAVTPFTISNCGELHVTKTSSPAGVDGAGFAYSVTQADDKPVHDVTLDPAAVTATDEPDADVGELDATIAVGETDRWVNVISQPDYLLTEHDLPVGWELDRITCSYVDVFQPLPNTTTVTIYEDGAPTGDLFVIPPISFANESLPPTTCTIVNATAAIAVAKAGAGDPTSSFDFTVTGHDPLPLALGQSSEPLAVGPGETVTVGETVPDVSPAWSLTAVACVDDDGVEVFADVDLAAGSADVEAVLGTLITCTFTNVQEGRIIVEKESVGADGTFEFTGSVAGSITTSDGLTPVGAELDADLPAGVHTVEEVPTDGFELSAAVCDDGSSPNAIELAAGEVVTCTFTNTFVPPNADVAIAKSASVELVGPGSTFSWTLEVSNAGPDRADDVVVSDVVPPELVVLGITSAEFECGLVGNAVTCAVDALEAGAGGTVVIVVDVPADARSGAVVNTATVTAATEDPDPSNNVAEASVDVVVQLAPTPPPTTPPPTTAPPTPRPPAAPPTSVASAPPISVASAPPIAPVSNLPSTGSGGTPLLVVAGTSLLVLGAAALFAARRRAVDSLAHPPG